jgi:hypothetical protein
MPKDAKKNVDRYKIRGGDINEFEFHKNQEQFVEQKPGPAKPTKAAKPTSTKAGRKAKK